MTHLCTYNLWLCCATHHTDTSKNPKDSLRGDCLHLWIKAHHITPSRNGDESSEDGLLWLPIWGRKRKKKREKKQQPYRQSFHVMDCICQCKIAYTWWRLGIAVWERYQKTWLSETASKELALWKGILCPTGRKQSTSKAFIWIFSLSPPPNPPPTPPQTPTPPPHAHTNTHTRTYTHSVSVGLSLSLSLFSCQREVGIHSPQRRQTKCWKTCAPLVALSCYTIHSSEIRLGPSRSSCIPTRCIWISEDWRPSWEASLPSSHGVGVAARPSRRRDSAILPGSTVLWQGAVELTSWEEGRLLRQCHNTCHNGQSFECKTRKENRTQRRGCKTISTTSNPSLVTVLATVLIRTTRHSLHSHHSSSGGTLAVHPYRRHCLLSPSRLPGTLTRTTPGLHTFPSSVCCRHPPTIFDPCYLSVWLSVVGSSAR